ncbi:MAG: DUF4292 domain-containing protein [Bacteroidales bacterium]|nr:DUF4292 domain-containing protein [Bacteroidales bacterium]MBS3774299.1 DUF4292 domain-containing protein [Bacteroidales bacterium]
MKINVLLLVGFLFILSFCGPQKELIQTAPDLPEASDRLYPFVEERNTPYRSLTIRNIKINFSTPDNNSSLYGSLKMIKDSAILISLRTTLGMEISRLLYTEDSVKMLDRQNKKAYFTNYNRLSEIAPLDFDFRLLQSIFSGNIPENYRNAQMPEPKLTRDSVENEVYLGTYEAPHGKDYMNFYGWIYEDLARPSHLVFYKDEENKKFTVKFLDYQKEATHLFPDRVEVVFDQFNQSHKLTLKLNGISRNEFNDIQMDIPSSYKTIYHSK